MGKFIIGRILWIFPTIFVLSTLIFITSKHTDRDPVEAVLASQGITFDTNPNYKSLYAKEYIDQGHNLPLYYFSIVPDYYPLNIYTIKDERERTMTAHLLSSGYSLATISQYNILLQSIKKDTNLITYKIESYTPSELRNQDIYNLLPPVQKQELDLVLSKKHSFYLPSVRFHGLTNQYHQWLSNILKGRWGYSFLDGRPVIDKVKGAFSWTFILMVINLSLLLILGVPIVIFVIYKGGITGQIMEWVTMIFYIIPIFWLATLMQVFLTNPDYGLNFFGIYQDDYASNKSVIDIANQFMTRYLPAVICLLLTDLAVFIRLLRGNISKESLLPYADTATAKGASQWTVLTRHILPNTMIPIVTLIVGSIPLFIAGSLIIEVIFNIPGMGRLLYNSITKADWAVVYFIVLIIGVLTTTFFLIGDLLYKYLDPKIKLD